jgi:hypothetical protein
MSVCIFPTYVYASNTPEAGNVDPWSLLKEINRPGHYCWLQRLGAHIFGSQ